MTTRAGAILMAVLLALYVLLVGWRAVQFIATGEPAAVGIGIALIVLPIIAAWALWRELAFGVRSQALMRRLEALFAQYNENGLVEFRYTTEVFYGTI